MSAITKNTGSAAIECDCPTCHAEVLGMTPEAAAAEAEADGWQADPDGSHLCPDCAVGNCPGEAAAIARYGVSRATVIATRAVSKGDEVRDQNGQVIGRFAQPALAGQPVDVDFVLPRPGKAGSRQSCMAGRPRTTGLVIERANGPEPSCGRSGGSAN